MQLSEAIRLVRCQADPTAVLRLVVAEARAVRSELELDPDLKHQVDQHRKLTTLMNLTPLTVGSLASTLPLAAALVTPAAPLVAASAVPAALGAVGAALRYPVNREAHRQRKAHAQAVQLARNAARRQAALQHLAQRRPDSEGEATPG